MGLREARYEGDRNLCRNLEFIGVPPFDDGMEKQIWVPKSQISALPQMEALEAAMLEPLGALIDAVDLAKPRLLEPVKPLGACSIGPLVLQISKSVAWARCM